jgi:hypothetical protein
MIHAPGCSLKIMLRVLAIVTLLGLLSIPAWTQQLHTVHTTCSYSDTARHISLVKKPCVLRETRVNKHFAWTIKFSGGPAVTVEYLDSDGPDHIWNINGEPGKGHERDREHLRGATNDKNQTIEWFEPD